MQVNTTKCVDEEAGDGLISLLFVSFSWLSASPTATFPGEDLPTHTHAHTNLQSVKKNYQRRTVSVCHQKPIFFSVQPQFWAFLQSRSQWMILLLLVCSSETVLVRKKKNAQICGWVWGCSSCRLYLFFIASAMMEPMSPLNRDFICYVGISGFIRWSFCLFQSVCLLLHSCTLTSDLTIQRPGFSIASSRNCTRNTCTHDLCLSLSFFALSVLLLLLPAVNQKKAEGILEMMTLSVYSAPEDR